MVLMMDAADLGFRFEWHPEARAVYAMWINGDKHEQIASDIHSPEVAMFAATMWCKGYRSKTREIGRKPGAKYYHMLAEGGLIGTKSGTK